MLLIVLFVVLGSAAFGTASDQWQPASGPLMTRWAANVRPDHVLPEYPRPQLVRHDWLNLNGLWDYAIRPRDEAAPATFDGRILVPFPVESALSGVMKKVGEANRLWYRRTFDVPRGWRERRRTLLHFGAVDWDATVYVNGKEVGNAPRRVRRVHVRHHRRAEAVEARKSSSCPSGIRRTPARSRAASRSTTRASIWYTSVTGIWQTVWIEPVPHVAIDSLAIVPDIDAEPRAGHRDPEAGGTAIPRGNFRRCPRRQARGRARERPRGTTGRAHDPEAEALVARFAIALRFEGHARRHGWRATRRGDLLLRDAQVVALQGRRRASRACASTTRRSSRSARSTRAGGPMASTRRRPTRRCGTTSR